MDTTLGRFGRLGLWTADHRRAVAVAWLTVAVGRGGLALFAEHALSGAGWMAVGSQSDREAKLVDRYFPVRAATRYSRSSAPTRGFAHRRDARPSRVSGACWKGPPPYVACSDPGCDGRTDGNRRGPRGARPDEHGACGRGPREPACRGGGAGRHRPADRPGGDVADFNTNNKQAMMRSEVLSWPLTMVLLVIAFGTLVAAGLPLLLTMVGLASAAGVLFLGAQFMDTIWAMNFAMMFAIALPAQPQQPGSRERRCRFPAPPITDALRAWWLLN